MAAAPLISTKRLFSDGHVVRVVIWLLPPPVPPARHPYKYRLFYGRPRERIVGFDNERGKGDHKHVRGIETEHGFTTVQRLLRDFAAEVELVTGRRV